VSKKQGKWRMEIMKNEECRMKKRGKKKRGKKLRMRSKESV
jgi:hypothetical protein